MRFTLGKMFLAIAMLALACAAMRSRTALGSDLFYSLTIVCFVVAAIRAVGLEARRRAAALIFAAVGLGYLLLTTMTPIGDARESLVTNYALAYAAKALSPTVVSLPIEPPPPTDPSLSSYSTTAPPPSAPPDPSVAFLILSGVHSGDSIHYFFLIGHCVFSWLFAALAAWFAGRMYDRRERATKEAT